jgi:hypothetical protein
MRSVHKFSLWSRCPTSDEIRSRTGSRAIGCFQRTSIVGHTVSQGRVVITQDTDFLRINAAGIEHTGIIFYPSQSRSVGQVVRGVTLIWELLEPDEMRNRVEYRLSRTLGGVGPLPTRTPCEIPANRRTLAPAGGFGAPRMRESHSSAQSRQVRTQPSISACPMQASPQCSHSWAQAVQASMQLLYVSWVMWSSLRVGMSRIGAYFGSTG